VDAVAAEHDACWRCGKEIHDDTVSCRLRAVHAERAGVVPAIQTAAATLAGLQSEALIELLHGHSSAPRRTWLNIRSGESASARLTADPCCGGAHSLLPAAVPVDLGPAAPISALLDAAAGHLDGEPALQLPWPFVDAGVCPRCDTVISVRAPGHRYRRSPFCAACGGRWTALDGDDHDLNPISRVRRGDPLANVDAATAGLAPGHRVVVSDASSEIVLRLAGSADDLFLPAR
jgi:hypothetical protein